MQSQCLKEKPFCFLAHHPCFEVKGLGIDLVSPTRIARLIERYADSSLGLLFTLNELQYCRLASDPNWAYAVCFGAKEAIGKALATGLAEIDWNEIETNPNGQQLTVCLHGQARVRAQKLNIQRWFLNWWHLEAYVLVHAVAIGIVKSEE
ncbi:4'-phosphopantetheinyl transferase superfamily protein [Leptolyngbyaceae cyanobacterium CCMR0082]|uniref:4'-phosphopantetheinyl transferase superfamily protein n=1 Tax=Adonisia turfae CCMR0082 TaxID=2304604 RepID=A0A6M0RZA2_9CYAN|nr:4'-phosphopantetheinyl transferase superfamily protein [Adonisia turfae CCMR0082]